MPPFTPKHWRAQGIGSLVGDRLRNISIEPDNIMRGFNILRKCKNKLDCLISEMVFIKELKPTLNIRAMLLVMHVLRFLHSHLLRRLSYLYAIFYFTLIWKWPQRGRYAVHFLSLIFITKSLSKNFLLTIYGERKMEIKSLVWNIWKHIYYSPAGRSINWKTVNLGLENTAWSRAKQLMFSSVQLTVWMTMAMENNTSIDLPTSLPAQLRVAMTHAKRA